MKALRWIIGMCAVALLVGCSEELPKPLRKERTEVRFVADWSAVASDFVRPEQYSLRLNDVEYPATDTQTEVTLIAHKDYTLVAFNQVPLVEIEGTTARYTTTRSGNNLLSIDDFAASVLELPSLKGGACEITVPMQQRSYRFKIDLGLMDNNVSMAEGTLSGIASAVDLRSGNVLSTDTTKIRFDVEHHGDADHLVASAGVLGLSGRQILDMEVFTLTSNYHLTCDLTKALSTLSSRDDNTELILSADLALSGLTGTISDWTVSEHGRLEIE